jgi:transcriptional regulator with XRE-family HTH domain
MSLTNNVAQNLCALRRDRKLSQAAVAKSSGMSVSYVSMLERGQRSPPLETVEALAKAFKVSPVSLVEKPSARRPRSRRKQ